MIWIALERQTVLIEGAQQGVNTGPEIQSLIPQRLQGTIQLGHGLKLLDGRREVILQRGLLIRTIAETPKQQSQTLEKPHAMNEAILIMLQPLLLVWILEISSLKLLQLLLLFSPLLFGTLLFLLESHQGICSNAPVHPGISHLCLDLCQRRTTETVQP